MMSKTTKAKLINVANSLMFKAQNENSRLSYLRCSVDIAQHHVTFDIGGAILAALTTAVSLLRVLQYLRQLQAQHVSHHRKIAESST